MSAASELKELMLKTPRWTLAVAESLTAGHVQARVAAVSGASEYFLGGLTAYSLDQKVALLGVDRTEAAKVDCVSAAVAEQMARGVCERFGAEIGVATTGYAEPFGPAQDGPAKAQGVAAPFAWWAVAASTSARGRGPRRFLTWHGRVECPGASRVEAQAIVAEAAIAELVAILRGVRGAK